MNASGSRKYYLFLGAIAVAAGLFVHTRGNWIPRDARDIAGDALWATMMACWISAIVPSQRAAIRYSAALLVCFFVELSQFWHTPALEYARAIPVARLVLGSGFDPRDFVAYTVGVLVFIALDRSLILRSGRES